MHAQYNDHYLYIAAIIHTTFATSIIITEKLICSIRRDPVASDTWVRNFIKIKEIVEAVGRGDVLGFSFLSKGF